MENKKDEVDELEEYVLGSLHQTHGIVAPDHASQKKSKKRKQAGGDLVPEDPPVETYNSDEDE